jgi:hypothetical protein
MDLLPFKQLDPPAAIRQQSTRSELTSANVCVVHSGYNLISIVGLFGIACREWRTKATAAKAMKTDSKYFFAQSDPESIDRTFFHSAFFSSFHDDAEL